jgi:hypothetical protein
VIQHLVVARVTEAATNNVLLAKVVLVVVVLLEKHTRAMLCLPKIAAAATI